MVGIEIRRPWCDICACNRVFHILVFKFGEFIWLVEWDKWAVYLSMHRQPNYPCARSKTRIEKTRHDMHHWFCHTISVCAKWHKILIQGHKFQARYVQKVVSFENENRTQFYQMNKNCYHNRIILKPMPEHSKGANRTQRSYSKLFMDRMPSKNWWLYDQL